MLKYLKYAALIPILIPLIFDTEGLIQDARAGIVKRERVMNIFSRILSALTQVGVFHQDEITKIYPRFGELVDVIVGFLNDFGVFKHT